MGIPDRLFNIAKGHLDRALDRWDQIDAVAKRELDSFMASHLSHNGDPAWDRAVRKINSAQTARELASASETTAPIDIVAGSSLPAVPPASAAPPPNDALRAAYKMIGVDPGADWLSVRSAYNSLRERAAPEKFPEDSPEKQKAVDIRRRIDSAYILLSNTLAPSGERFDRLEI